MLLERLNNPAWLKIPPPCASVPSPPEPPEPAIKPPPRMPVPPVPCRPRAPLLPTAMLFATTTEVSVTWPPEFKSPPPSSAWPPWIVNPEICTRPLRTWKTRSNELPSIMVELARLPLIVTFPLISRSPVAALSSLAPAIVNLIVPFGSRIVSEFGLELAASIADRNEIWPDASFPVLRFTVTESSSVLTLNVERTRRVSSDSP